MVIYSHIIIVPFGTLYPRCTLAYRFLGSDLKSYLGIQYGTFFLLRKKKIVLLYVRRVVLVPSVHLNDLKAVGVVGVVGVASVVGVYHKYSRIPNVGLMGQVSPGTGKSIEGTARH